MKNLKNRVFAAVAAAVIVFSGVCAFAATPSPQPATARPRPGSGTTQTATAQPEKATATPKAESDDDKTSESTDKTTEKKATTTIVTTAEPTAAPKAEVEKKYTTKGGAFGWFLLSVIINAVLSFAIGNRFYKMAKKDTHIASEIRALRRDVEEKFAANVGGFSEQATDIANSNDDYSTETDGIKMKEEEEKEESAEEVFRKWESQLAAQRAERRAAIREAVRPRSASPVSETEDDEEEHEPYSVRSQAYKPRRDIVFGEDENDEDEDIDDEDFEGEESKISSIKNKARELITDIFPFKED